MTIKVLADAVAAALGLHDRFGTAHAAALLDEQGEVLDLTAFTGEHHTIETALHWSRCSVQGNSRIRRLVLLSAAADDLSQPRESDLATFRRARGIFADADVDVVDWVQTDGDLIRTVALTESATAAATYVP